jgi:hypothetical protein
MSAARELLTPWQRAYAASQAVAIRLRTAEAPPFIGQTPLTAHERTAALRVFEQSADPFATLCKSACIRSGLTVQVERQPSDRQWRVRELILQGGARRVHVRRLAEVFLSAERALGLPDPADTVECVRFADFAARLDLHPRLRIILEPTKRVGTPPSMRGSAGMRYPMGHLWPRNWQGRLPS